MDVEALGPWLHNIHLPDGRETAPDHALGDWPARLWRGFSHAFEDDLSGLRVLDIGCNAGFYSFEFARRGAHVTGIDPNPRYLRQARAVAKELGLEAHTEFRRAQIYELGSWTERFDIVLFLGVFYHLRYPTLGLDLAVDRCRGRFVFQTLMHGSVGDGRVDTPDAQVGDDLAFLGEDSWPSMAFIERELFGDTTNWWVPRGNAVAPLLRSAGLVVDEVAGGHVFLCSTEDGRIGLPERARMELAAATGKPWADAAEDTFRPAEGTLETTVVRRRTRGS